MLEDGQRVGQQLARVKLVRQPVDHRDVGILRELFDVLTDGTSESSRRLGSATSPEPYRKSVRRGPSAAVSRAETARGRRAASMPTSNEMRVRVDDLSKIMPSVFPARSVCVNRVFCASFSNSARCTRLRQIIAGEIAEVKQVFTRHHAMTSPQRVLQPDRQIIRTQRHNGRRSTPQGVLHIAHCHSQTPLRSRWSDVFLCVACTVKVSSVDHPCIIIHESVLYQLAAGTAWESPGDTVKAAARRD